METEAGEAQLRGLIQAHVDATNSAKGASILNDWANALPKFWQLVPPSEATTPEASVEAATEKVQGQKVPASAA